MEHEILFLSLDKLYSTKKEKDYYIARYLIDNSPVQDFISKETFEKLTIRKLEGLKKYIAKFNINASQRTFSLFDIKA